MVRFSQALLLAVGFLSMAALPSHAVLQPAAMERDYYAGEDTEIYLDVPDGWTYTEADLSDILLVYDRNGYTFDRVYLGNSVAIHPEEFAFSDYELPAVTGSYTSYFYDESLYIDSWRDAEIDGLQPKDSFFVSYLFDNFLIKPQLGAKQSLAENDSLPIITITRYSATPIPTGLNKLGLANHFHSVMDVWGKESRIGSVDEHGWGWEVHDVISNGLYKFDSHHIDERHYFFKDGSYYVVKIYTPRYYEYDEAGTNKMLDTLVIKGVTVPEFHVVALMAAAGMAAMIVLLAKRSDLSIIRA